VLEQWVLELFGNVKKGPQVNLEFKAETPIWKAGKIYRLEAVKDVHILHLTWTFPCLRQDYLKKAEDYLSHLLGHGEIIYYQLCFIHFSSAEHKVFIFNKRM
jgi:nardilysin